MAKKRSEADSSTTSTPPAKKAPRKSKSKSPAAVDDKANDQHEEYDEVVETTSASASASASSSSGPRLWVITGASRGIGLGFVNALLERGDTVAAGYLASDGKDSLEALKAVYGDNKLLIHELDVTNSASVQAFGKWLDAARKGMPVGFLINNAGIYLQKSTALQNVDPEAVMQMINVNSVGPLRVAKALLPMFSASSEAKPPVVVGISSRQGSLRMVRGAMKIYAKSYGYKMSKAAQNCFTLTLSVDQPQLCCIAVHPGFVITEMTKMKATQTVEDSCAKLLRIIDGLKHSDTGKFFDVDGKELEW